MIYCRVGWCLSRPVSLPEITTTRSKPDDQQTLFEQPVTPAPDRGSRRQGRADNDDSRMQAAGERALALARKARREGKGGLVTDGKGTFAIVEK